MKVCPANYRYKTCPHCKSKKLSSVALVRLDDDQFSKSMEQVCQTGYLCGNCKRYVLSGQIKYTYDRTEMRRDSKRLMDFLEDKQ